MESPHLSHDPRRDTLPNFGKGAWPWIKNSNWMWSTNLSKKGFKKIQIWSKRSWWVKIRVQYDQASLKQGVKSAEHTCTKRYTNTLWAHNIPSHISHDIPITCLPLINASKPHTAALLSSGKTYLASIAELFWFVYFWSTTTCQKRYPWK
jgi:hypothetical protein